MAALTPPTLVTKQPGQQYTAAEYNTLANAVLTLYAYINARFDDNGSIKEEVNIMPLFDNTKFVKSGGVITLGDGSQVPTLPVPEAPTISANSNTRIIQFGHSVYVNDLQYRVNGGAWIDYVAGTQINFGNGAIAANYYQARVKYVADVHDYSAISGNSAIAAAGSPTLSDPAFTFSNVAQTSLTATLSAVTNATLYIFWRFVSGDWQLLQNSSSRVLNDTGLTAGTAYQYRGQAAAPGYNSSNFVTATQNTLSGGGTPVVERTIRVNFQSEYSSNPSTGGVIWNNLKPTNAQLQAALGFTSGFLNTDAGAATTAKVTNVIAFSGGTAGVATPTPSTGLYPAEIVNSGWEFNGTGTEYIVRITGLKADKFYQLRMASASINGVDDSTTFKSGTDTVNHLSYNNFGTSGENELNSNLWAIINNRVTNGSGVLEFSVKGNAGGYTKFLTALLLQETNIAV